MSRLVKKTPADENLQRRFRDVSTQCQDLYEEDVNQAMWSCFRRHCRCVWQRLEPDERAAMRANVECDEASPAGQCAASMIDYRCLEIIEKALAETPALAQCPVPPARA